MANGDVLCHRHEGIGRGRCHRENVLGREEVCIITSTKRRPITSPTKNGDKSNKDGGGGGGGGVPFPSVPLSPGPACDLIGFEICPKPGAKEVPVRTLGRHGTVTLTICLPGIRASGYQEEERKKKYKKTKKTKENKKGEATGRMKTDKEAPVPMAGPGTHRARVRTCWRYIPMYPSGTVQYNTFHIFTCYMYIYK